MTASDSHRSPKPRTKIREDGWTAERQLRFLDALVRSRSVIKAASFAGMSRESAYRLRDRRDGALFAALWDRTLNGHASRHLARSGRSTGAPISGGNPPKVTNPTHPTTPRLRASRARNCDLGLADLLRQFARDGRSPF